MLKSRGTIVGAVPQVGTRVCAPVSREAMTSRVEVSVPTTFRPNNVHVRTKEKAAPGVARVDTQFPFPRQATATRGVVSLSGHRLRGDGSSEVPQTAAHSLTPSPITGAVVPAVFSWLGSRRGRVSHVHDLHAKRGRDHRLPRKGRLRRNVVATSRPPRRRVQLGGAPLHPVAVRGTGTSPGQRSPRRVVIVASRGDPSGVSSIPLSIVFF